MATLSPLEALRKEHQALVADAAALRQTVRRLCAGTETAVEVWGGPLRARLRAFQRDFRLHCRREEECLYPEARQAILDDLVPDQGLEQFLAGEAPEDLSAHAGINARTAEVLALVEAVEATGSLSEEALGRLRAMLGMALTMLARHAAKEDRMVFPVLERCLSGHQMARVQEQLWTMPTGDESGRDSGPGRDEPR